MVGREGEILIDAAEGQEEGGSEGDVEVHFSCLLKGRSPLVLCGDR